MASSTKKVILVTGGNSGVGLECCKALVKQDNIHVILVGRNPERIDQAVKDVQQGAVATRSVEGGIADLASLRSVREYCETLLARKVELFALVLNGGIQLLEKQVTEDGFERTIAVNHIGHFLMLTMLKDHTKRIVTLSSETHDPAQPTPAPPPNVSDLDQLAVGYEKYDGFEVYATSKLLTTLVAKEFPRRYPDGAEILAYSPGFVPNTGLYRNNDDLKPEELVPMMKEKGIAVATPEYSGGFLAQIASVDSWEEHGWHTADYISKDEVLEASKQANDAVLGKELWDKSEQWIARVK